VFKLPCSYIAVYSLHKYLSTHTATASQTFFGTEKGETLYLYSHVKVPD